MSLPSHQTLVSAEAQPGHFGLLHQFFERTARRWPQQTALEIPPSAKHPQRVKISYAELDHYANTMAGALSPFVTEECVVAILLPKSIELYVSQLAMLKAGAAYSCIDPAFPNEQLRDILEDAAAVAVLTDRNGLVRLAECGLDSCPVFDASVLMAQPLDEALAAPAWLKPDSLAYIIYTSGTTGRPKGVMIEHASIANLVASDMEEFRLTPDDRVGQSSSPAYDSSLEET